MFRISQFMQEIAAPTPLGPARKPPGPVVIWNLIRRCNLTCKHCYSISADKDFAGELSTAEVFRVMDQLKAFRVPALILSGGEPLLRPDIFEISARSKQMGFFTALSSNGTLIDASMCEKHQGHRLRLRRRQPRRPRRHARQVPPHAGRLRQVAGRHPPVPRRRAQGRRALSP
jgi:sulfatase maturation enzyme AslB (radical SAM superfamily)